MYFFIFTATLIAALKRNFEDTIFFGTVHLNLLHIGSYVYVAKYADLLAFMHAWVYR